MTVINLPLNFSDAVIPDDGLIYKQVIPMDKEIVYGGKKIKFTRDILERLKANYDAHVFDQTAFQLADDQNRHDTEEDIAKERNWDPERYRGELATLTVDSVNGLVMGVKPTPEGLNLIKKNPKLGVSASIKKNYVDDQGRTHDYVLRHVVGTLNPKIKGMSPWQMGSITLSDRDNQDEEVFDLTTTEPTNDQSNNNSVTISREEYDRMQSTLAEFEQGDEILDQMLAEIEDEEVTPEGVNLSDSQPAKDPALVALENRVAASEWKAEKASLVASGVPAGLLNMCDDVMSVADDFTINLSDGESVDPRETIRKLLNECRGQVDLSDEQGHGKTVDEREAEKSNRDSYVDGFIGTYINPVF